MIILIKRIFGVLLCGIGFSVSVLAQNTQDSLLTTIAQGDNKTKCNSFMQLAQSVRNQNPQLASNYAQQALDHAKLSADETLLAKSQQLLGSLELNNGNLSKSKELFTEALIHFTNTNNRKATADVNAALGAVCYNQGNLSLASDYYLKGLRLYEEDQNKSGMVNVFGSLSNIYSRQNNFTKSIEYSLKAIVIYEESANKFKALVNYDNIGNIYFKQGDFGKARVYLNKSLALYTDLKNDAGVASTLFQLGNIEFQAGNTAKANSYYRRSLGMSKRMGIKPLVVSNLNALGKLNTQLQLYPEAIANYNEALKISKSLNLKIELEESYEGLALIYKTTKNKDKAATFGSLSREIKDSLYNDRIIKNLNDQLLLYESGKQQQQILLLNKEQQIKQIELERERTTRRFFNTAFGVLVVVLLILIAILIQNRRIATSLRKQQAELVEKNNSIMEQKEKLDQLNSVKDRFFSIISHDLRNSLTTMKLYFDLISNEHYEPMDTKDITQQISGSVENTIDLLENLLVWASAQIKGIPIHLQKINIHTIAEENINLLSANAATKNIAIINHVREEAIAFADIDMINLVMRNLITNAIKFTSDNGLIEISSTNNQGLCEVEVKDNGIGISEENLARLFDQHQHPSTKGTGNEKGTGLGLILCKDFIERNGGKIWVKSNKDHGASFHFSLPIAEQKWA